MNEITELDTILDRLAAIGRRQRKAAEANQQTSADNSNSVDSAENLQETAKIAKQRTD